MFTESLTNIIKVPGTVATFPEYGRKWICDPRLIRWMGQMLEKQPINRSKTIQTELRGQDASHFEL